LAPLAPKYGSSSKIGPRLFYERQLCVRFEKKYFHWITSRALKQLADEGRLATNLEAMADLRDEDNQLLTLRYYRHRSHRYWRRQAQQIAEWVRRFAGELGRSLGDYGELLVMRHWGARVSSGLPGMCGRGVERRGTGRSTTWTESTSRTRLPTDARSRNTLKYSPSVERETKQAMCVHLGLKPLFIVRWLPKSHINEVVTAGGFAILFEQQLYPIGQEKLAGKSRKGWGFPRPVNLWSEPQA
jgi:hypothetical protein